MKRAFHGFLRIARKPLAAVGLTPARFDMMCAILGDVHPDSDASGEIFQRELRDELGVSAPVVSRMVRALERLGLVRRERLDGDRRLWVVVLTDSGLECIRKVRRWMLRGMQRIVCEAICFGQHRSVVARFEHMEALESYLLVLRRDFSDRAELYYPWGHPDD